MSFRLKKRDNIVALSLIFFSILIGFLGKFINATFGASKDVTCYWEFAAIVSTFFYSAYTYRKYFFSSKGKKVNFKNKELGIIGLAIFFLFVASVLSLFNFFDVIISINSNEHMISKYFILLLLACSFSMFCIIDVLGKDKGKNKKIRDSYSKLLYYSDIPLLSSIVILLLTATIIYDIDGTEQQFFSGAIAFQMIVSNIVWMFADDEIQ